MISCSQDLCDGLTQEFQLFLEYVRKLNFSERPDYELLRGMFREVMEAKGYRNDGVFDWLRLSHLSEEE